MNKIFIISGPSGVGEDSVIEGLKKHISFNRVITTVTRPKLSGEKQRKPYYFVTEKKFKKLIQEKAFVEWAKVYDDYRGCTKKEIHRLLKQKKPIIWKVDWQGVKAIKKNFPHAISIMIRPPSYKILEKRILKRGRDDISIIKKRRVFTQYWLKQKNIYDYTVVNREGRLRQTIHKVSNIIQSHLTA